MINLKKINKKEFNITSDNGLNLIHPRKNKWDWDEEEKWFRSVIVDDKGNILSCSFPKFGNYGEFRGDTNKLKKALRDGKTVRFSQKEDGSLCIRSVINGNVILRTRGTLYGGQASDDGTPSYGDRFKKVVKEKYPILLDPLWMNDVTLLFEYVSPDNRVVLSYKESDLVFIGGVYHKPLKLFQWSELKEIANENNLNLVKLHTLPNKPEDIIKEIQTWKIEGVVARTNDDQTLVKIKSAFYLAHHRMKFQMNYSRLVDIVQTANIENEKNLLDVFKEFDYDWEVLESVKEIYKRIKESQEKVEDWVLYARNRYKEILKDLPNHVSDKVYRKLFAAEVSREEKHIKSMIFLLYDNKEETLQLKARSLVQNECKLKYK